MESSMTQQWYRPTTYANGNGDLFAQAPTEDKIEEELHQALIRDIDESVLRGLDRDQSRTQVERAARVLSTELYPNLVGDAKEEVITHVVDEVLGLGPIEPLLND